MNVEVSCPKCGGKGKVLKRRISREGVIIRRRRCGRCLHHWYTAQVEEVCCPDAVVRYGFDADGIEQVYLADGPFKEELL
jgi:transcriptional regulator NrdR family protein